METSIERVSTDSTGQQANQASFHAAISTDGRYVAFTSCATNLVDGESTGCDIFVKDLLTGETNRVNTDSAGQQGNSYSFGASISNDGRYVAFESYASNLVNGDTNGKVDIFVKDLVTGATTLVNTGIGGYQGIAGFQVNGHYVVFASNAANLVEGDTNRAYDVFIKDLFTGETTRVSTDSAGRQADGSSFHAAISADGRYVAFTSQARNLVDSDTNGQANIFVKDLVTGTTTLVSTGIAGHRAADDSDRPAISADGRYVAFSSDASNLVTGDTNGTSDIFVKDLLTGTTTRISTDSDGQQADKISGVPSISADGYYVTFWSWASNLVAGDSNRADDVFVKDLLTGTTTRVSTNDAGRQANGHSFPSTTTQSISADGRYVTFESSASNLVNGDTNKWTDVFVKSLATAAGTAGDDRVDGGASADHLFGLAGNDTLVAGAGNDRMNGNDGDDLLFGNGGNDGIAGGTGRDSFHGGLGDDTLDGGNGHDAAAFGTAGQGVSVDLVAGTATGTGTGNDVLRDIEEVFGSRFDDDIRGDANDNWFTGGAGNDTLDGGDGRDTASYADATQGVTVDLAAGAASGRGEDRLIDIEAVIGSRYDDDLRGGAGNDWLTGGGGNDTLDGREGRDVAGYGTADGGVTVDLAAGTASGHGEDRLIGIEGVIGGGFDDDIGGSAGDDWLAGGGGNDAIRGGAGRDTMLGGAGDDRLDGGDGSDWLLGGAGADVFRFASQTVVADDIDIIADFTSGEDRIDLQAFGFTDLNDVLALVSADGNDLVLDLGAAGGPEVILTHVTALHADDILV